MVTPKKRRPNRSQNRAGQRYTPPSDSRADAGASGGMIPAPPNSCQPWHFYWCKNHNDWHHHDEFVVTAISRTMQQGQ